VTGEITEHFRSEGSVVASCNNVLMVFALAAPSGKDFDALVDAGIRVLPARWPSGYGVMLCVGRGVRPPDRAGRERAVSALRRLGPRTRAMACVVLGQGFGAAAVRSVMSAAGLAIRSDYETKVFDSTTTALTWLTRRLEGTDGASFNNLVLCENVRRIVTG